MSTSADQRALDPGLHVRTDAFPVALAETLAAEFDADLCTTAPEAEAILAAVSAHPALTAEALDLLGELTGRLVAAQRIADRTLERAAAAVGERLAATGSGVAIHPSAVRERADAVVAARTALAAAVAAVEAWEADVDSVAPVAEPAPPVEAELPATVAPTRTRRGFFSFFRRRGREVEDTTESTSLLQQVAASTEEVFGARRAIAARDEELVLLGAQRIRAQEELRVAERAWQDLAGDDAVEDVDEVVRRFDPQHEDARDVARDTVGVRAVMTLLEGARARWEEAWRSFDVEPPASADLDAMDAMATRLSRTVIVVGPAVDFAELLALAAPAGAVVAVEPDSA